MRALLALVIGAGSLTLGFLLPAVTVEAQSEGGGGACCQGGNSGDGDDDSPPTVSSWVLGATNGGVSRPSGTSSCSGWSIANAGTFDGPDQGDPTAQSTIEVNGEPWSFWQRTCEGIIQAVWAPAYSPEDLARIALLEVERNLPAPSPVTSPSNDVGGFVSLETWLQVGTEADVSATAGPLPNGLTATTTATPVRIEWTPIAGGEKITCELWGSLPTEAEANDDVAAPCGWLPPGPSAPQYGAGDDLLFRGSIELVWSVAWTATDGTGGDLGELTSDAPWSYRVREIQTIGEDR